MEKLRIATRGSKLSLIQAERVAENIKKILPRVKVETLIVKTKGDVVTDTPLYKIGYKGIFEKEVNKRVIEGKADLAVHSLKDVPSEVDSRLVLAAVLPRDPPYDVLVSRREAYTLYTLPEKSKVGTSSIRRVEMLKIERPDLQIEPIRGNVDTRIKKLRSGMYDAIVLAEAGILRLKENVKYSRLDVKTVTPAPCQGIIGVYALRENVEILKLLRKIDDWKTRVEAEVEREILKRIRGGCHTPFGALAEVRGDKVRVIASLANSRERRKLTVDVLGDLKDLEGVVEKTVKILRQNF